MKSNLMEKIIYFSFCVIKEINSPFSVTTFSVTTFVAILNTKVYLYKFRRKENELTDRKFLFNISFSFCVISKNIGLLEGERSQQLSITA